MNRTQRTHWLLSGLLALSAFQVGCGDDDDGGDTSMGTDSGMEDSGMPPDDDAGGTDAGEDTGTEVDSGEDAGPPNPACTAAIEARESEVSSMLPFSNDDATEMVMTGGDQNLEADYAGKYRDDLENHPGCVPRDSYDNNSEAFITDNEATVPAGVPYDAADYPCAAKEYTQDSEDTSKPIVILVHGNSSGVLSFEEYDVAARHGTTIGNVSGFEFTVDSTVRPQLATQLLEDGYKVISFDARTDLVPTLGDYSADMTAGNPFSNIDHGWAVPILQALIRSVMANNAGRQISLVGHSLGVTVIRDALRRLFNESVDGGGANPFAVVKDVVLLSGANHGVTAGGTFCTTWTHMRGTVTCEMGDLVSFQPTYFTMPNNGPSDLYVAPCADGSFAYGMEDACDGNVVQYTTVTMQDIDGGALQDEFVSEASSLLDLEPCVDNQTIGLEDFDSSSFFLTILPGFFANHFGTIRSDAGIQRIMTALGD